MDEYVNQIKNYLPIYFQAPENENYIQYLIDTYLENLDKAKYQFSFIAFHLLFMVYVYKANWFQKNPKPQSLFDLSVINEKTLLQSLKNYNFHDNQISDFCELVNKRNHCAHASGLIQYGQEKIERFIKDELEIINQVHEKLISSCNKLLIKFFHDNWNEETRPYSGAQESTDAFIRENLLSVKDLELLIDLPLDELNQKPTSERIIYIKTLYLVFIFEAQNYLGLEENLFIKKLPILTDGFRDQNKIKMRDIVFNNFTHIITQLSDTEQKEFNKLVRIDIQKVL